MNKIANRSITRKRQQDLIQEVLDQKYCIDRLPNVSYDLTGERSAAYFAHARSNMNSDLAHVLMYSYQQNDDLKFLEALR